MRIGCAVARSFLCVTVTSVSLAASPVWAAATDAEAARLGAELTPVGAERAGNAEGTIPEWTGGDLVAPAGWVVGQPRPNPYASDKLSFSIDASNVDEYKGKLSEGQIALIKQIKDYRMDVYPTRRSCGYPDFVYERTKKNATSAKASDDGYRIVEATPAGVPFPIPKTGAEAIWNHKLRWVGEGWVGTYSSIFSQPAGGDFVPLVQDQWTYTPFGDPRFNTLQEMGGIELKMLNEVVSPAARVGELILFHYYLGQNNDSWLYFPGQRRVRRAPTFAYDAPVPGYENLIVIDQYPMYSGAMDRYSFELVGKQELFVPYNTFKMNDATLKMKDIYGPDMPRRDFIRYELHRVWRVDATVREGMRHTFPKRTFYLDEDTWTLMVVDLFDAQGKPWRVQEAYMESVWELPACAFQAWVSYDLNVGRYIADSVQQEGKTDWLAGREGRIDPKKFDANQLRRAGSR